MYLDVAGDMIKIYPVRKLMLVWVACCVATLSARFHVHRQTLHNRHVSIKYCMGLLDAIASPAVLHAFSRLTDKQLLDLGCVQQHMLRSIVGWRHSADEEWSDTMRRMNAHVAAMISSMPFGSALLST